MNVYGDVKTFEEQLGKSLFCYSLASYVTLYFTSQSKCRSFTSVENRICKRLQFDFLL